jgi:hypothetical protein
VDKGYSFPAFGQFFEMHLARKTLFRTFNGLKKIFRIFLFMLVASCTKEKSYEAISGLDYYPVQSGRYVIYAVDSISYQELPRDTFSTHFFLKEKLADSYNDNEGKPVIRLERYFRNNDTLPWNIREVWLVQAERLRLVQQENNVRYTKLVFPPAENKTWDGNAANNLGEQIYTFEYVDRAETVGGHQLEKVLKVRQKDYRSLISEAVYSEKYASGIGLVSREKTDIYSNHILPGVPIENRIESGIIYRQTLISYGTE